MPKVWCLADAIPFAARRQGVKLFGFTVSAHVLDLYPDVPWNQFCPVAEIGQHVGKVVTIAGMIVADRVVQQSTGEPIKFITICDYSGMLETELFAQQYRWFGLQTIRHPVVQVTGKVSSYANGRGYGLEVIRLSPGSSEEVIGKLAEPNRCIRTNA